MTSEPAVSTSTVALGTAAPVALLACTDPETLPVISCATARITGRKLNPFRALFPRVTKLRPTSKSSVITEPFSVSAIGLSRITLIPEWPALGNWIAGCVPSLSVIDDLLGSMIRRNPLYVPVGSVVAPRFIVLPSLRSRRLINALGVATLVHPSLFDSSAASSSVGSALLTSRRTTYTSTLDTSENGKGMSVSRTVSIPVPVPEESLQAPSAMAPTIKAQSRIVLIISLSPASNS